MGLATWQTNFAEQWRNPQDIFSLLLIIGGDIVHAALAQLVGNSRWIPAPVPFSFGWVAYAYNSIIMTVGERRIMPETADVASIIVNASNGISRVNNSWVLGRLLRDKEPEVKRDVALKIEIYEMKGSRTWSAQIDAVWWSGVATIGLQFLIAAVPVALYRDWTNLIITGGGTALALTSSLFPQWEREKWACRKIRSFKSKTVCITKGNGNPYVLVVKADGGDLNLEDLAAGKSRPSTTSKYMTLVYALLWVALLITATGQKQHSWYLLGVGLLGMIQNLYAAGARRSSQAHGMPLKLKAEIQAMKVMDVLKAAEKDYPGVGRSLLTLFFPDGLRPDEEKFWKQPENLGPAPETDNLQPSQAPTK